MGDQFGNFDRVYLSKNNKKIVKHCTLLKDMSNFNKGAIAISCVTAYSLCCMHLIYIKKYR